MSEYAPAVTLVIDDAPQIRGLSSPRYTSSVIDIHQHVNLEEALVALAGQPVAEPADQLIGLDPASPDSASGYISLPHQPPLYGVSSLCPISSVMNGPTRCRAG